MSEITLPAPRLWHTDLLRDTLKRAPDGLTRWQVWLAFRKQGAGALDTISAIESAKDARLIVEWNGRLSLVPSHPAMK
jgi:hypothetical protein